MKRCSHCVAAGVVSVSSLVMAAMLSPSCVFAADVTAAIPKSMPASTDAPAKATPDPSAKPANANSTSAKPALAKPSAGAASAAKKPVKDPAVAIVADAVQKLTQDYKAAWKSDGVLRSESDYFGKTPPPELTPEKVVAAIAKPVAADAGLDSYVRWQLLSAVPGPFDEKLAGKVLAIYRAAPKPTARLGTAPQERKELERMLRGKSSEADAEQINTQFRAAVDRRSAGNTSVYAFRDLLLAKLPVSAESITAAMADALDRYRAGDAAAGGAAMRHVEQLVATWSISVEGNRPRAIVADMVERLRREPPVEYADAVEVKQGGQLKWRIGNARPSGKQLDAIIDALKGGDVTFGGAASGDNKGRKAK
jgi:hypothetical protein